RFADALLRGLTPAWMIHPRVHVGVEAIFIRGILAPSGARLPCHQLDFDKGLDALETVFPRYDQPKGSAILWRQRASIQPAGQQGQRVHRFIHSQALDIRPVEHIAPLSRHALGIQQGLEGDILRIAERLDQIEKFGQRKTSPRNHHGPSFDATHTIYPFFRRADLQQVVEVEDSWFSCQALDRHLPAFGFKISRRRSHPFLVGREFIEIIVMRDVLKGGRRLGYAKTSGIRCRRRGCQSLDQGGVNSARCHMIETPIDQAGGCGAGRKDPSPYECPTIEVNGGVGYLTGGYFVWILHRINHWLNYTDRLAEFQDGSIQNAEMPIFSSPVPSPPLHGGEGGVKILVLVALRGGQRLI